MKKNLIFIGVVILLILAAGVYFFMQKYPSANNSAPSNLNIVNNSLTYKVSMEGYKFSPSTITINKGSMVAWTNNDPVAHTVTSDSGTELTSSLIGTGNSYSHIFDTIGVFDYHCSVHPSMKGKVIVQ
jgi:plastocyanin